MSIYPTLPSLRHDFAWHLLCHVFSSGAINFDVVMARRNLTRRMAAELCSGADACHCVDSTVMKRVPAPYRIVDGNYVVAHPDDGRVLVLTALVGWVWTQLEDEGWDDLKLVIGEQYPDVPVHERIAVLTETLGLLRTEGLVA